MILIVILMIIVAVVAIIRLIRIKIIIVIIININNRNVKNNEGATAIIISDSVKDGNRVCIRFTLIPRWSLIREGKKKKLNWNKECRITGLSISNALFFV